MNAPMNIENRWLLVDGNSLVTYLWFRSGPGKDIASQVWLYLADLLVSYDLCRVAVAWDQSYSKARKTGAGSTQCRRRQQYQAYKGNRQGHPEWANAKPRVMAEVKESLKHIPVVQGTLDELEADDVLWCWTQMIGGLIISGDEDLWQCCNDNVRVWSPRKKEEVGLAHIKEKYGSVQAMMVQKALVGDNSDNITGVMGIGWSRAKKLWEEKSDKLMALLQGTIHIDDDKWMLTVIDQMEVFLRNWKIIKLGEIINENDMMKAETFLMQPVKFDSNDARHYAAYKGWHEIIRKWNAIEKAFQQAIPK
jgi:5'-3' exonuclease